MKRNDTGTQSYIKKMKSARNSKYAGKQKNFSCFFFVSG